MTAATGARGSHLGRCTADACDEEVELLPLWRDDDDDRQFFEGLFTETLAQAQENEAYVQEAAANWDLERIALMDRILMKMALAEARTFSSIPLKVTLNEYIELSKYYSTPKSHGFINGILDELFGKLKKDGVIKKPGRGLMHAHRTVVARQLAARPQRD